MLVWQCRVINLVSVVRNDIVDAELIGSYKKFPIGNALRNPQTADSRRNWLHFKYPAFMLIGNHQGFTCSIETIGIYELAHELYSFPGSAAALQGDAGQFGGIENASAGFNRPIFQPEGIVRAFAEHQALLAHYRIVAVDIGIGMGCLGNLSKRQGFRELGIIVARSPLRSVQARR